MNRGLVWLVAAGLCATLAQGQPGLTPGRQLEFSKDEVELVILTPGGFWPRQIIRKPGAFRLVLVDGQGAVKADFDLVDESGQLKGNPSVDRSKSRRWNERLELNPGKYTLRVKSQPAVALPIVIDPNRK